MRFGTFVFSISADPDADHEVITQTLREVEIAEEVGFAMSRSWGNRVPRWESKIAPIKASSPPTIHAFKRCQAGSENRPVHQARELRFEVHQLQEIFESGIRTKTVEPGLDLEKTNIISSFLIGFFQPPEGLILFTNETIDQREVQRRNIFFLRLHFELL